MTRYVEPPPKSPTRLLGKCGRSWSWPSPKQRAGDRDVVQVVAGGLRQRAVLAPAGHPAVDQPRVAGQAVVGAEAEPLGRRRGACPRPARRRRSTRSSTVATAVGVLEVERDAGPAAVEQVVRPAGERLAAGPLDADHVGAEVGQDHAGVRARARCRRSRRPSPRAAARCPGRVRSHAAIMTGRCHGPVGATSAPARTARAARGAGTGGCAPRGGRLKICAGRALLEDPALVEEADRGGDLAGEAPSRGWPAPSWCPARPGRGRSSSTSPTSSGSSAAVISSSSSSVGCGAQRADQRGPLLLAAGQPVGVLVGLVGEPELRRAASRARSSASALR